MQDALLRGLHCLRKRSSKWFDDLLEKEDLIWKQRSRTVWLKDGDRNTRFFHRSAKQRGFKNRLLGICDTNGDWISDDNGIGNVFCSYFDDLFKSTYRGTPPSIIDAVETKVAQRMNEDLCKAFTRADIEFALSQMYPCKSPGVDGMPALFLAPLSKEKAN